jgi:hypothetical protein
MSQKDNATALFTAIDIEDMLRLNHESLYSGLPDES